MIRYQQVTIPATTTIDLLDTMGIPLGDYRVYVQFTDASGPTLVDSISSVGAGFDLGAQFAGLGTFNLPLHGDTIFLRVNGSSPLTIKVLVVSEAPPSSAPLSVTSTFNY